MSNNRTLADLASGALSVDYLNIATSGGGLFNMGTTGDFTIGMTPVAPIVDVTSVNISGPEVHTKYFINGVLQGELTVNPFGEMQIGTVGPNDLMFLTNNTIKMTLDGNGNLGLGMFPVDPGGGFAGISIGGTSGAIMDFYAAGNMRGRSFAGTTLMSFDAVGASTFLRFRTNSTERFRIDANGAWGLGGANYGTSGQVLTSQGSGAAPVWAPPSGVDPGAVMGFAMSTPPAGWLKANGAAVSRTTYAALFAAIGTTHGAGDGSTTFNLPDYRGEFIRGWDDGRGVDSGRALGSFQADQNQSHTHSVSDPGHNHTLQMVIMTGGTNSGDGTNRVTVPSSNRNNSPAWTTVAQTGSIPGEMRNLAATTGISLGSNGGTEARPRNVATLICIRF